MPQGLGFCLCVVGAHTCVRRLEDNLECCTRGATQEKDLNGSAINKASARHPEDSTHKHWDCQCSTTSSFSYWVQGTKPMLVVTLLTATSQAKVWDFFSLLIVWEYIPGSFIYNMFKIARSQEA